MKTFFVPLCGTLLVAAVVISTTSRSSAQPTRILGAEAFTLDNGNGHHLTLLPPSPLDEDYTFVFPPPPSIPGLSPAFISGGHSVGDIAVWDGSEWVWGNAVSSAAMGGSSPFPFSFTFNEHAGPASNGLLDLGDATHHFRTLYVDNIVGASVGLGPVLSGDATGPQGATLVIALLQVFEYAP